MIAGVAKQHLVVQLALEIQMHEALPGKSDAAVELDRTARGISGGVAGRGLGHMRRPRRVRRLMIDRAGRVVDM